MLRINVEELLRTKRNHCDDNINKFKKRLSDVKWKEVLNNNDANDDYNKCVDTFEIIQ